MTDPGSAGTIVKARPKGKKISSPRAEVRSVRYQLILGDTGERCDTKVEHRLSERDAAKKTTKRTSGEERC